MFILLRGNPITPPPHTHTPTPPPPTSDGPGLASASFSGLRRVNGASHGADQFPGGVPERAVREQQYSLQQPTGAASGPLQKSRLQRLLDGGGGGSVVWLLTGGGELVGIRGSWSVSGGVGRYQGELVGIRGSWPVSGGVGRCQGELAGVMVSRCHGISGERGQWG